MQTKVLGVGCRCRDVSAGIRFSVFGFIVSGFGFKKIRVRGSGWNRT